MYWWGTCSPLHTISLNQPTKGFRQNEDLLVQRPSCFQHCSPRMNHCLVRSKIPSIHKPLIFYSLKCPHPMKDCICFLQHPQILSLFSFFLSSRWGTFAKDQMQASTLKVDACNRSNK